MPFSATTQAIEKLSEPATHERLWSEEAETTDMAAAVSSNVRHAC